MPQALATFGSDFTLIATLFPNKTRRQIKNKYSKESKVHANVVHSYHWQLQNQQAMVPSMCTHVFMAI